MDYEAQTQTRAQAMTGAVAPVDAMLDRLRTWLDRLVAALTTIVAKLAGATSFSISVGSMVSVAVQFGPFASTARA
jgi:hypothetical protein